MKGYFIGGFIGNCANAFVLAKEHGLFDNFMIGSFTVVLVVAMGICGGLAMLAVKDLIKRLR
jgi:predicted CDP-diglyceride synthetase/phosphatidate cytidylyltransferase